MTGSNSKNGTTEDPNTASRDDHALSELREALFGREQVQLAQLHENFYDPKSLAEAVSKVLPDAITLRDTRDERLMESLGPILEKGLHYSVKSNPEPLIDILFPIIGPAIRRSVAVSIQSMIQTINQTLEHTFSPKALKWRWEAIRTGRPYAEIVIKNSLTHKAEQAFLIHRDSGLLLLHVADSASVVRDEDMVGGMLTAIREFVKDSFAVNSEQGLQVIEVGDLTVWIEQSPTAVLALVLRGTPVEALKMRMRRVLESVHEQYADKIRAFCGDSSEFAPAADLLRDCLTSEKPKSVATRKNRSGMIKAVTFTILVGLVILLTVFWIRSSRRNAAWVEYVTRLDHQAGIVVIESGTRSGRYFVRVLRDPLAESPLSLLGNGLIHPEDIDIEERPFQSLDADIEARRRR